MVEKLSTKLSAQLILLLTINAFTCTALSAQTKLQSHQGRYFKVSVPEQWQVNENSNAVEVSAPDGRTGYSFVLLMGGFGQMSPQTFLNMQLQNPIYKNPKILSSRQLPNQPGPMGIAWQVLESELEYIYSGAKVHAYVVTAVLQGSGQYSAVVRAYQAPVEKWEKLRSLLAKVDKSLLITNPYQVAGLDKVKLPKGTSHDEIYGSYNKGREQRQRESDARLSQRRHESTMEYERMKDPATGRFYDMPMNQYDPTVGGYRNPNDPTQLLVPASPGE